MNFEWDPKKASQNFKKHKVSFNEAATVFSDTLSVTVRDPDHSFDEDRYITVGISQNFKFLMVAHTERGDSIRIISARKLTPKEKKAYEKEVRGNGR